jgi:hypothetical protein
MPGGCLSYLCDSHGAPRRGQPQCVPQSRSSPVSRPIYRSTFSRLGLQKRRRKTRHVVVDVRIVQDRPRSCDHTGRARGHCRPAREPTLSACSMFNHQAGGSSTERQKNRQKLADIRAVYLMPILQPRMQHHRKSSSWRISMASRFPIISLILDTACMSFDRRVAGSWSR